MSSENKNLPELPHPGAYLRDIIRRNRSSEGVGVYAVCSAHPEVIAAAASEAHANESILHVESTSSQVNPLGGKLQSNLRVLSGPRHTTPDFPATESCSVAIISARSLGVVNPYPAR